MSERFSILWYSSEDVEDVQGEHVEHVESVQEHTYIPIWFYWIRVDVVCPLARP